MPCFFKQSLEGRTCSARVQRCPDSCLIVFVCVCWNLIGWVARFAVLFHAGCQWLHATCLQKFDTLLSPSLCRGWYSKCSVLLFPHPHYLWNWTWLPRNEGEGISEEEAELGKRYFSSLPKAMRCCYLLLFDAIWCYLMLYACSHALSSPTVSQQFSKIKEASLIYRKFSGLFLLLKCRFWKGRQIHRPQHIGHDSFGRANPYWRLCRRCWASTCA